MRRGTAPLLISMPHTGTFLPPEISARLTHEALKLPDTDWHLERLYDFVDRLGASVIIATHSRYAIDLNRPPDDASLYPGRDTTGLCPVDTFDREPLYREGLQPDDSEVQRRVDAYWEPYHTALQTELGRLRGRCDRVVLWDAHSIRSVVPRFFQGKLPDLNLGSAGGLSCDRSLAQRLLQMAQDHPSYTAVLDDRFKGGYITRRYGRPSEGVHAIQLELAQLTYMRENHPYSFDEGLAATLRPLLDRLLREALRWARS